MQRASERSTEATANASHTLIAGRYEVLEEVGDGAAGTTYRARHTLLDTLLCVTVLPAALSDDPPQLALVQDAVRRACGLRHEHIVPVLDFGEEANRYHLVEAFVDAEPLDRVLADGKPLAPADALHVARQLADALTYAHGRGIVHGALIPATVRIHREAPPRALLSGFVTAALAPLVPYSAPERLAGACDDPRSDVFALGLLLFEMLEGKRFFPGSDEEIRDVLLHGNGPLLPQFSCIVPSGVSGLVGRSLRRSPAHRPQTMAQMRSEIGACLRRLGERRGEAKAPRSGDIPVRKHQVLVDEALEQAAEAPERSAEDTGAPPPVAAGPATRSQRRAAVKVEPATPAPGIRARVPARASGIRVAARRRLAVAGVILIAAVGLAASCPILRTATVAPAASEAASNAARVPVEQPASTPHPAPEVVAPPAPKPIAPVADEDPPALVDISDQAAAAVEGRQPEAAAGSPSLAKPAAVRHVGPRIVGHWPRRRDAIPVMEGAALDFGVRARDGDSDAALAYSWSLDGHRAGRQQRFRFLAPPAATAATHAVEVRVSDAAGRTAPRVSWRVAVTPRMREADVRDWLDRLASAWERRDIATLRLYGIVSRDDEIPAIRKRMPHAKDHHVSIGVETIRTKGQYATAAFALAEFDARGKLVSSQRESYELEKQASGFVGLRAR